MTMPVHVLSRVPGATDTVEWTDVCHGGPFVFITHRPSRKRDNWSSVERKRPFIVCRWQKYWTEYSAHKTLAAALLAAAKVARKAG
jgi:hypothetical protein